ncbi:hypothetical protein NPIL_123671 [Nephila pilipes]|uniref:Uncharacterized protein n=1 Tax=Nephila pilipes TaxID=299642 RepID=A0A8X6NJB2_NEPPI|nr:hypothetical protein NPIL_123671 [Nephila pilipes]
MFWVHSQRSCNLLIRIRNCPVADARNDNEIFKFKYTDAFYTKISHSNELQVLQMNATQVSPNCLSGEYASLVSSSIFAIGIPSSRDDARADLPSDEVFQLPYHVLRGQTDTVH